MLSDSETEKAVEIIIYFKAHSCYIPLPSAPPPFITQYFMCRVKTKYKAPDLASIKPLFILFASCSSQLSLSALCPHRDYTSCQFAKICGTLNHVGGGGGRRILRVNFRQPHVRPLDCTITFFLARWQSNAKSEFSFVMSVCPSDYRSAWNIPDSAARIFVKLISVISTKIHLHLYSSVEFRQK